MVQRRITPKESSTIAELKRHRSKFREAKAARILCVGAGYRLTERRDLPKERGPKKCLRVLLDLWLNTICACRK